MKRPGFTSIVEGRADVKMTPMIDVVFLLLIFFLLTSTFQASEELLPTHLPQTGAVEAQIDVPPEVQDLEQIVIDLRWPGRLVVELNGGRYEDLQRVRAVLVGTDGQPGLGALAPELPVILDVEDAVPLEYVVDVYDLCRLAGFEKVHFAVAGP
jgi:biopolymer transport protein ExbD